MARTVYLCTSQNLFGDDNDDDDHDHDHDSDDDNDYVGDGHVLVPDDDPDITHALYHVHCLYRTLERR